VGSFQDEGFESLPWEGDLPPIFLEGTAVMWPVLTPPRLILLTPPHLERMAEVMKYRLGAVERLREEHSCVKSLKPWWFPSNADVSSGNVGRRRKVNHFYRDMVSCFTEGRIARAHDRTEAKYVLEWLFVQNLAGKEVYGFPVSEFVCGDGWQGARGMYAFDAKEKEVCDLCAKQYLNPPPLRSPSEFPLLPFSVVDKPVSWTVAKSRLGVLPSWLHPSWVDAVEATRKDPWCPSGVQWVSFFLRTDTPGGEESLEKKAVKKLFSLAEEGDFIVGVETVDEAITPRVQNIRLDVWFTTH